MKFPDLKNNNRLNDCDDAFHRPVSSWGEFPNKRGNAALKSLLQFLTSPSKEKIQPSIHPSIHWMVNYHALKSSNPEWIIIWIWINGLERDAILKCRAKMWQLEHGRRRPREREREPTPAPPGGPSPSNRNNGDEWPVGVPLVIFFFPALMLRCHSQHNVKDETQRKWDNEIMTVLTIIVIWSGLNGQKMNSWLN